MNDGAIHSSDQNEVGPARTDVEIGQVQSHQRRRTGGSDRVADPPQAVADRDLARRRVVHRARHGGRLHLGLLESIETMVGRLGCLDHPAPGPKHNALAHRDLRKPVETTVSDRHFGSDQREEGRPVQARFGLPVRPERIDPVVVYEPGNLRVAVGQVEMLDAPHARFAGAKGRAEFVLANSVRAKDSDARDDRPLCHAPIPPLFSLNRPGAWKPGCEPPKAINTRLEK